ncbi:hypothetical protein GALMADRAFT_1160089 [Galerina marginata CBS 339.88]|uniref:MYND-type domain-containing protein n=1 Tax=Galerina marginata (strain CBS 339.88) TaxID=685588 RepID=A0A067SF90_GALM3|nr:hypothetical protein GALMADRAFT_1160089 [Galerina marginata CBS 339.88]
MPPPQLQENNALSPEDSEIFSNFLTNLKTLPPRKSLALGNSKSCCCFRCGRAPAVNEPSFSKCARCKSVFYCSRECQKKDWPVHKRACSDSEKQRGFILKSVLRWQDDQEIMNALILAVAYGFLDKFTMTPNPRKVWVAGAVIGLLPCDKLDMQALLSPDVPLTTHLKKPMMGGLRVMDVYEDKDFTVDGRTRAMWQSCRDNMDSIGLWDFHVVVVMFHNKRNTMYGIPCVVPPHDLVAVKRREMESLPHDWTGSHNPMLQG